MYFSIFRNSQIYIKSTIMMSGLPNDLIKDKRKVFIEPNQKNIEFFHNIKKDKINLGFYKFYQIENIIMVYLILILSPKQILSENCIKIKLNQAGEQQVISNDFSGELPSLRVNSEISYLNGKKIYVESVNDELRLYWNNGINNFSNMFSNLKNIIEVHIYNMLSNDNIFSYTFSNCIN